MLHARVAIVGSGHGGAQTAIALRQLGFSDSISMISAEEHLPYERPPLSKEYLSGEKSFEQLLLRTAAFWAQRRIDMHLGRRVVAVDARAHVVEFHDGTALRYGHLVWASGGRARTLSCEGYDARGIHTVRSRDDVDRIKEDLGPAGRIIVIGGGYLGLEVAAVLVKLGKAVVLLEAMERILARIGGAELSAFFEAEHRKYGVDVRTSTAVERIVTEKGRFAGVRLRGGELVEGEMAIIAIGIDPEVGPMRAAGAEVTNGVCVDACCRTNLPDVFAVGDCAVHPNVFAGAAMVRLESVQNAADQASVASKGILGKPVCYDAVPWFWSNQYDLRLQTVGLSLGHDETVLRGDSGAGSFSIIYLRAGRIIALDCVNAAKDYVQGRRLVAQRVVADRLRLADSSIALKEIGA